MVGSCRHTGAHTSAADDHTAFFWVASVGDRYEELRQRTFGSLVPHDVDDSVHRLIALLAGQRAGLLTQWLSGD